MDTSDTMNLQFSPRCALRGADKTDGGAARQTGREGGGRRGSVCVWGGGGQVAGLFVFFFFFFFLRLSDLDSKAAASNSGSLLWYCNRLSPLFVSPSVCSALLTVSLTLRRRWRFLTTAATTSL